MKQKLYVEILGLIMGEGEPCIEYRNRVRDEFIKTAKKCRCQE